MSTRSEFNQPLGGNDMPRFAGIASMMRLPVVTDPKALDLAFIGVPLDGGTTNRTGARFGLREIAASRCCCVLVSHGHRRAAL